MRDDKVVVGVDDRSSWIDQSSPWDHEKRSKGESQYSLANEGDIDGWSILSDYYLLQNLIILPSVNHGDLNAFVDYNDYDADYE